MTYIVCKRLGSVTSIKFIKSHRIGYKYICIINGTNKAIYHKKLGTILPNDQVNGKIFSSRYWAGEDSIET